MWCGAPEGDRADWLVEKLGEVGVARLRLVDTERGRWERAEKRAERWERLAVAAMRQSLSAFRLRIEPPARLADLLAAGVPPAGAWLADPDGAPFAAAGAAGPGPFAAAVGPSAGFSAAERNALSGSGFVPTRLTPSRLRTETAALALAAAVLGA